MDTNLANGFIMPSKLQTSSLSFYVKKLYRNIFLYMSIIRDLIFSKEKLILIASKQKIFRLIM